MVPKSRSPENVVTQEGGVDDFLAVIFAQGLHARVIMTNENHHGGTVGPNDTMRWTHMLQYV